MRNLHKLFLSAGYMFVSCSTNNGQVSVDIDGKIDCNYDMINLDLIPDFWISRIVIEPKDV